MKTYPPIALFVYNRPDHVERTLQALANNYGVENFPVYIFSDAAKDANAEIGVKKVREIIHKNDTLSIVEIIENSENKGLAESITSGVTRLVTEYGSVIVLEDDLVTSPYFLQFMDEALTDYRSVPEIMHINGFCLPAEFKPALEECYVYRQALSWGWATWKDRWDYFINDANVLLKKLEEEKLIDYLDIDGTFRFSSTLRANARGDIKTWAIKWYATIVLRRGLTVTPYCSLIQNIGHDASGTNANKNIHFETKMCDHKPSLVISDLHEQPCVKESLQNFYQSIRPTFFEKLLARLSFIIKK